VSAPLKAAAPAALAVDSRTRFLREITARVPAVKITELYMFAPMRQGGVETGVAVVAVAGDDEASTRQTIYTATYRLTLKGLDRGKWEAALHAEADAPLLTVSAVVRGVQRRSGDEMELERLTASDLAEFAPADGMGRAD
jgi:predicted dinucleotide-binding enzyme